MSEYNDYGHDEEANVSQNDEYDWSNEWPDEWGCRIQVAAVCVCEGEGGVLVMKSFNLVRMNFSTLTHACS